MQAYADLANGLRDWLGTMRYPVEVGFDNQAGTLAVLPMPWVASEPAVPPELQVWLIAPEVPGPGVSSPGPPTTAVLPSRDSATEKPCSDSLPFALPFMPTSLAS